jgi:mxaK protein
VAAEQGGDVDRGRAASAPADRASARERDRASSRPAVAPVWADDVASAASAASAAAAAPQVPAWLSDGSPPQWRFAQGLALARQGDLDDAMARYRSVFDDPGLGQLARYNSANTLLREAMRLSATAAPGQALVLFELAKEGYRSVLRRDPSFWAARYNLERALQLQPDGETVAAEPAQQAERAATTMRSVSRGLP